MDKAENASKINEIVQTAAPKKKKSKGKSLEKKKSKMGWFFISPFLAGFLLIYLPMIFQSIYFSFVKIEPVGGGGFNAIWVGWDNYAYALFEDANYFENLLKSLVSMAVNIPAILIFSLFMAILLNQKMRGRAVFRAIFFIPVIVSTGIIEHIDLLNASNQEIQQGITDATSNISGTANTGQDIINFIDVQRFFSGMKVGDGLVSYVTDLVKSVFSIVNKSGVQMLIFLAGLQSISPSIYESCYMEGASGWETFWKITFPMISPMILVNAIYTIIDSFTSQSNTVMKYISEVYNGANGNVRATAMSWIYFLIVIVILAIVAAIFSAYVFYQRKD